ncbi:MAG: DUF1080 domain-containing protein [Verrucomicrobia bacterium]|jgi:hypothetical protein|nr:DUF1080 domain-containing protein [Verrucomicrobiota bacterium]
MGLRIGQQFALRLILSLAPSAAAANEVVWHDLIDRELSQWEVWLGVPHSSVVGLPEGTYQSDNVHQGEPLGLHQDPKKVFSTQETDEETLLLISGEIYGGLTTLKTYQNYHFQTRFKWGERKWAPRLNEKRDSGIIYHAHGEHGAFWETWKSSLEFQVQEKDMGDFIPLGGAKASYRGVRQGGRIVFDPNAPEYINKGGYIHAKLEPDFPNGEWNTLDLYVLGDSAIHVVNGVVVFALTDAFDKEGNPLTPGQIQSEAAECFYKQMRIRPITEDLKGTKI